jgi:hypothetical protein
MTLLHNMSVPPRTAARVGGRPVASGVTVYSLPFALIITNLVPGGPYGPKLGHLILNDPSELASKTMQEFPSPAALFKRIGKPVLPALKHDFILGWRPSGAHLGDDCPRPEPAPEGWKAPRLCRDPRRCAGVLSRCYGTVLLGRREPDFSWERLLGPAVAFDEPLFPAA